MSGNDIVASLSVFMASERSLQLIYDQLFGEDDNETSAIASTALQAGFSVHAITQATQPVTFSQPDGLLLYKSWLSQQQQELLLASIQSEGWLRGTENQAMWFGALPVWAQEIADGLPLTLWPKQMSSRQPNFDQMIVNGYQPGEGICSHVDLLKFEDGIVIISLGSAATMSFTKTDSSVTQGSPAPQSESLWLDRQTDACSGKTCQSDGSCSGEHVQQSVYLQAGDVLLLQGEARYGWKHGIAFNQTYTLQSLERRVSITLRKLVQD